MVRRERRVHLQLFAFSAQMIRPVAFGVVRLRKPFVECLHDARLAESGLSTQHDDASRAEGGLRPRSLKLLE